MSTRSLTIFNDTWNHKEIVVMYRQSDGYPEGHGAELAEFLSGFRIVNGYNNTRGKIANGGSCLAAQVVAHFKDGVGNIYLEPASTRDMGCDYIYTVTPTEGAPVVIRVEHSDGKLIWEGDADDFDPTDLDTK